MRNLQVTKVVWVLSQGVFLPLVLWLDDFRGSGEFLQAVGVFALLEVLYVVDALLFLRVFNKK